MHLASNPEESEIPIYLLDQTRSTRQAPVGVDEYRKTRICETRPEGLDIIMRGHLPTRMLDSRRRTRKIAPSF